MWHSRENGSGHRMMKEICAQCLQPQRDPATGKVRYVFSCFNQDQPLDAVDFDALRARLEQNQVQEKLTAQWIARCTGEVAGALERETVPTKDLVTKQVLTG